MPHGRLLNQDEKVRLVHIDHGFWNREISDGRESFRRIERAYVIDYFEGKPISDFIRKIIVPAEAVAKARGIFADKVESSN